MVCLGERWPGNAHHTGSCVGKIGYVDRSLAEREAQRLANDLHVRVDVYRCWKCGELHVGKSASGHFVPTTEVQPAQEGERHDLVIRKRLIEGALTELRYGKADGKEAKRRRLVTQLAAIDLRLTEIKQQKEAEHECNQATVPSEGTT